MRGFALCALLLTVSAPAAARETGRQLMDRALAGRVAGPPQSCISLGRSIPSTIVDENTIFYRAGGTVYVQDFGGTCGVLREGAALVTQVPSTRLCRGDIVTVIDPPLPGTFGSCALGDFVPWRKAK